jgi:hypothetical protein
MALRVRFIVYLCKKRSEAVYLTYVYERIEINVTEKNNSTLNGNSMFIKKKWHSVKDI